MHLLVRETHGLDEAQAAVDLGQSPGEVVFLSFSDSDLGALASAWEAMGPSRPVLRLARLGSLGHPMSVDMYVDAVVRRARCVVLRLLGGLDYWRYGAEEVAAACAGAGIPLAVLPGDGRADAALAAMSTVEAGMLARLDALLGQGGAANAAAAIRLAAFVGGVGEDVGDRAVELSSFGFFSPPPAGGVGGGEPGHDSLVWTHPSPGPSRKGRGEGSAVVVFYRSYLLAGDTAPIEALMAALALRGLDPHAVYVPSLKDPDAAAFVAAALRRLRPAVVLNATGFSAGTAPLDAAGAPVLQLVLSGGTEAAWAGSSRGLSPADLAMQVALPELDGRLLTAAISFKEAADEVEGLEFARMVHRPHAEGVALAAERAAGWARLAATPPGARRIALVLSDYPGAGGQVGNAVGLDTFASAHAILTLLRGAGYAAELPGDLVSVVPRTILRRDEYARLFAALPEAARDRIRDAWGEPAGDFALRYETLGRVVLAVEPFRGGAADRRAGYHDPDLPPCHAYVAFHLWLRHVVGIDALVHLGAHGVLEWLPGKALALSAACFPRALLGGTPVVYPFIANNPGEAAAAKRRLGAVTIGHLTPPLREAGLHGAAADIEADIDEFAAADGLDRGRAALLRRAILARARAAGLLDECGAEDTTEDAALARLDAYLCDVKELRIRDGLHVFGVAPRPESRAALLACLAASCPELDAAELAARLDRSPGAEVAGLLAALDGRFVPPGPAGAPTAGRADVLPTGRNLTTLDPRTMPTRAAVTLAERAAADLLRRHVQDHGEMPRRVVLDLWGSAAMRTGGLDLATALVLLGVRPCWDAGSARVSGFEVLPIAVLDRPRVDVTLRISGLFRDAFEVQIALFDAAVRAVAVRDEAADWNPLMGNAGARVFGPAPGAYGAGQGASGAAYLAASSAAYGQGFDGRADAAAFAGIVGRADAFLHRQDHSEMDLLEGPEHALHQGGFAAAATLLGGAPAMYHADLARTRTLTEEIARVVRGRVANPAWIAGMMRHGYRGAAEIARGVEGLCAFAAFLPERLDRQFELVFAATLGDAEVAAFLARENPAAAADAAARFADMAARGLWRTGRNDLRAAA